VSKYGYESVNFSLNDISCDVFDDGTIEFKYAGKCEIYDSEKHTKSRIGEIRDDMIKSNINGREVARIIDIAYVHSLRVKGRLR